MILKLYILKGSFTDQNEIERPLTPQLIDVEKMQEKQLEIESKNFKITNLTRENQISKELNQTLIKLYKIKTIIADSTNAFYDPNSNKRDEAKANIDKFKLEEKKLIKTYFLLIFINL